MSRTKVRVNTRQIFKKYEEKLIKKTPWEKVAQEFRDYIIDVTIRRSRKNPSNMRALGVLEKNTKNRRKKIARSNSTHPAFSNSGKSNLTLSGALLNAVSPIATRFKKSAMVGFQADSDISHPGYNGVKRKGSEPTMGKIWEGLTGHGKNYNIFEGLQLTQRSYLISRILKPIIRRTSK